MSATVVDSRALAPAPADGSAAIRWLGRIATTLAVLFIVFDAFIKVVSSPMAVLATEQLGYVAHDVVLIGVIELACLALYLVPRTAVLGAVLFTGYLGGAVASNVRLDNPLFSHTLFPIYVAILLWGGLYARDPRARAMLAPRA